MSEIEGDGGGGYVLAFLRAAVRAGSLPDPPATGDWAGAARAHDVLPLMASLYARAGRVPPEPARRARDAASLSELRAAADLRELATELDGAGLAWALVKGPLLSRGFYEPQGLVRGCRDLDVLVDPGDFAAALELLAAAGAKPWDRNWPLMLRNGRAEMSWILPGGTLLDLHWNLTNLPHQRRRLCFDTGVLLDRRQTVVLDGGTAVPALDDLDAVVHLAVHACMSGGHRLRWLVDVQRALGHLDLDPGVVAERARTHRVNLAFSVLVLHVATWLDPALHRYARAGEGAGAWYGLARAWSRRHPPSSWTGGSRSGRWLFESTRDTTAASVAAGLREGARAAVHRADPAQSEQPVPRGAAMLNRPQGGPEARREYLDFVRRQSRGTELIHR